MSVTARTASAVLFTFAGLSLGGCMTDPGYVMMGGEKHVPYGYSDVDNGDGGHTIRVVRPAYSDPQIAFAFWERRAQEICNGAILRKNIHTAIRPTMIYDRYGGRPGDYILEGYVYCDGPSMAAVAAGPVSASPPAGRPPE